MAMAVACASCSEVDTTNEVSDAGAPAGGYLAWHVKTPTSEGYTIPFCTGTLIAPDVVLTAAHCVDDLDVKRAEAVALGNTLLGMGFGMGDDGNGGGVKRSIVAVKVIQTSPGYVRDEAAHDLAYLVLEAPIAGGMATVGRVAPKASCGYVTVGYGIDKPDYVPGAALGPRDRGLRKEVSLCVPEGSTRGAFIGAVVHGRGMLCFGDSGGPLLTSGGELSGVLSQAETCEPGVEVRYAPVASNLDFVDEALAQSRAPRR